MAWFLLLFLTFPTFSATSGRQLFLRGRVPATVRVIPVKDRGEPRIIGNGGKVMIQREARSPRIRVTTVSMP